MKFKLKNKEYRIKRYSEWYSIESPELVIGHKAPILKNLKLPGTVIDTETDKQSIYRPIMWHIILIYKEESTHRLLKKERTQVSYFNYDTFIEDCHIVLEAFDAQKKECKECIETLKNNKAYNIKKGLYPGGQLEQNQYIAPNS